PMENKNLSEVFGNVACPFLNSLPGKATNWHCVTNPSQPNYIAVFGGSTFGVAGDGNRPNLPNKTLVDIVEGSGRTWVAFAEGASGTGANINPPRGADHYPPLNYSSIFGNPARAANMKPGGPNEVIAALNAGVNFIWMTP